MSDYELVVSKRAKRATLRVLPGRGLVVSIPKGFPKVQLDKLVENNRVWIERSLADLDARTPCQYRQWPPPALSLEAIGVQISLSYTNKPRSGAQMHGNQMHVVQETRSRDEPVQDDAATVNLLISAAVDDKPAVAREISHHLKKLARKTLPGLLASHAHLHGLEYQRVSIRGQRSVWGSYSSSGTLSLNYKLLFLSRDLLDYVLLHELAHTVHHNHSEAFWRLLCSFNINARTLDRRLRDAAFLVPPWLELTHR